MASGGDGRKKILLVLLWNWLLAFYSAQWNRSEWKVVKKIAAFVAISRNNKIYCFKCFESEARFETAGTLFQSATKALIYCNWINRISQLQTPYASANASASWKCDKVSELSTVVANKALNRDDNCKAKLQLTDAGVRNKLSSDFLTPNSHKINIKAGVFVPFQLAAFVWT